MWFLYDFFLDFKWLIIMYWVITSVIFGCYAKYLNASHWGLACIPFIGKWYKRSLGGVNCVLVILSMLMELWYFIKGLPIVLLYYIIATSIVDYFFAKVVVEYTTPWKFAFIPFFKYYIMLKEISLCGNTIKATPIRNTKKMTS